MPIHLSMGQPAAVQATQCLLDCVCKCLNSKSFDQPFKAVLKFHIYWYVELRTIASFFYYYYGPTTTITIIMSRGFIMITS